VSQQPEFFSSPEHMLAQFQAQQEHMKMHTEDFNNRWKEFLLYAPLESLAVIQELLGAVTGGSGERALSLGNYFEGQLVGVVVGREAFCNPQEVSDIDIRSTLDYESKPEPCAHVKCQHHAFMPNVLDAVDPSCVRCLLPAGNQIHQEPLSER
jgi:hypothetical protein